MFLDLYVAAHTAAFFLLKYSLPLLFETPPVTGSPLPFLSLLLAACLAQPLITCEPHLHCPWLLLFLSHLPSLSNLTRSCGPTTTYKQVTTKHASQARGLSLAHDPTIPSPTDIPACLFSKHLQLDIPKMENGIHYWLPESLVYFLCTVAPPFTHPVRLLNISCIFPFLPLLPLHPHCCPGSGQHFAKVYCNDLLTNLCSQSGLPQFSLHTEVKNNLFKTQFGHILSSPKTLHCPQINF